MKKSYIGFLLLAGCILPMMAHGVSRNIPGTMRSADENITDTSNTRITPRTAVVKTVARTTTKQSDGRSETVNRSNVAASRSVKTVTDSSRNNLEQAVKTVGRNARTAAAGINNNPAVKRAGLVLRPSTAEVGGRAIIGETGKQTGSNIGGEIRNVQSRAATKKVSATAESIADAKNRLEQTADLNKSCQEQYNDCMDQFCAVIDANQKRCSCSANLSKYTKVEQAVKNANVELNDVAQRIRYVGLSADEIRAIMNATEAEVALDGQKDTTETRNMLEDIEKMIKDPTASYSSAAENSFGLDMDLDFSDDVSDIFSLDFLNTNSSSFSNLRGTDLYNAAKKRCNTILNQCVAAGATSKQITGNYDLAIDKDCIAYEQGLTKMNESLKTNVRSATRMLQKARLAVLQNKNTYDAKGCIGALESCMTDDMVCGADYTKCIDPTKKYIDENGNVVLGQNITKVQDFMENYNNGDINSTFLGDAYRTTITENTCAGSEAGKDGKCIVKYLLNKIGTKQKVTDEGLCRAVLDKCQGYTYNSNGKYEPYNDVVTNYIQRALVNIKARQHSIISDYASTCMADIESCYNQQVTQVNSWSSTASAGSIYNVMRGACRNVALTCAYAVFSADTASCPANNADTCINNISEMFYQSMLCPDNSTYDATGNQKSPNNMHAGMVNAKCRCDEGYVTFSGQCLPQCESGYIYNTNGICVLNPNTYDNTATNENGENTGQSDTTGTNDSNTGNDTNDESNTCPEHASTAIVASMPPVISGCWCTAGYRPSENQCVLDGMSRDTDTEETVSSAEMQ